MLVNTVQLSTGHKVLLLEDFFEDSLLESVLQLCDNYASDPDWKSAEWTQQRKIYQGNSVIYQNLLAALASDAVCNPIEQALGNKIQFQTASLWADLPGFGPLLPHVENGGQGQAQIYLTRQDQPFNGTTILNLDKKFLFTLPYRNNYGWYFDECTKIMHSRESDVVHDTVRYSLIFWYMNV